MKQFLMKQTFMKLSTGHPAQLVIGLTVWCVWFVAAYGGLSVACELAAPEPNRGAFNAISLTLIVLTVLTVLWLAWGAWTCWQSTTDQVDSTERQTPFIARVSAGLYAVAALAALVVVWPLLMLPPCL